MLALEDAGYRVEIVDGEIVEKAAPTVDHGDVQVNVGAALHPFRRRHGGPGPVGWWFAAEVDVQFEVHQVFRPDVAGWRRDRVPEKPKDFPTRTKPDWVCEILSGSTASVDLGKKKAVYHRHGVGHYWIIDPERQLLTVMRWTEDGYADVLTAVPGDLVRAEPFEAVEIDVGELCGLDALDDRVP